MSLLDLPSPNDEVVQELDSSFNKTFTYQNPGDNPWQLPSRVLDGEETVWFDGELESIKKRLNDVKSKLSDTDIISWQNHTQVFSKCPKLLSGFFLRICLSLELRDA